MNISDVLRFGERLVANPVVLPTCVMLLVGKKLDAISWEELKVFIQGIFKLLLFNAHILLFNI